MFWISLETYEDWSPGSKIGYIGLIQLIQILILHDV